MCYLLFIKVKIKFRLNKDVYRILIFESMFVFDLRKLKIDWIYYDWLGYKVLVCKYYVWLGLREIVLK